MKKYSFIFEADVVQQPLPQPAIDNTNPIQNQQSTTEPLIKSMADIPLSKDGVERLKVAAQIRQIEAKTKEIEAKTLQAQQAPMGGAVDPMTGMPMGGAVDPMTGMPMGGGAIDPMTGMPMNPNAGVVDPMTGMPIDPNAQLQNNDPLRGLGDRSSPVDPMGGMMGMGGAVDPMTGMPMGGMPMDSSIAFTALGRAQKLKDIYTSLLLIRRTLKKQSDDRLQKLAKQTNEIVNLLKLVINNLKSYKDQIDSLIIMYYEFLKQITTTIESIMQEKKLDSDYE